MNVTNPKRSSRLAAKEIRESAEPKDVEVDSRKRGRDKSDNFSSIYKRATPASAKKASQIPTSNEIEVSSPGGGTPPVKARERPTAVVQPVVNIPVPTEQKINSPLIIVEASSTVRIGLGNGPNSSTEIEKDVVQSPAQRAPNNLLVSKLKESQKIKGTVSNVKVSPKPASVVPGQQHNFGPKNPRLQTTKPPGTFDAPNQQSQARQHDARLPVHRPENSSSGSEFKLLNDRPAHSAAHSKAAREKRGSVTGAEHASVRGLPNADNEDLRRRLGGAVERWISARSALPGGEGDDLGVFRPEIERLVKLIAFEAFEIKKELDEAEGADRGAAAAAVAAAASVGDVCGREVTTTRFRLEHPEVKAPFVFESTQHVFSGSVLGTAGQHHRLEGLRWKVEFELIGFFVLALHTQTYEVEEDVELPRLEKVITPARFFPFRRSQF